MAYDIHIMDYALEDLAEIRVFDRRRITDQIHRQLTLQPTMATRNRKRLDTETPDFEHTRPVWELRVGDYRVFYDVDEPDQTVYVRAVRRKEHGQTTEDIIRERDNT
jgi:mRNA-degrading endonuclease RelE of RelBE toxin-antitoxin system